MLIQDFPQSPRITHTIQLVSQISLAQSPRDVLTAISEHYWQLRPSDYMISMSTKGLPEGQYRVTRQIDVAAIRTGQTTLAAADPWGNRGPVPVVSGGVLGEFIRRRRPLLVHNMDVRGDPVLGDALAHLGSAVVIPLYDEGEPRYWNIAFRKEPAAYTEENLEQSVLIANLTGGTNTRLMLMEQIRQLNAALRHEFDEVARVQRALLPRQIPLIPGLQIATSYATSDQAGGDYYDFFRFQDDAGGFFIADVSGHGAAAATVMAMLRGILHAYAGPGRDPAAVLCYANARLMEAGIEGTFVTAFLGVLDLHGPDATFTYARAGHNPPLLRRAQDGAITTLDHGPNGVAGLPLGIAEPYEIAGDRIPLHPGDTILLYTDGLTEAMNASRELFGLDRLSAALSGCAESPEKIVSTVLTAVRAHTGSPGRADDQTLVAIRYVPVP